jgi:hypothetical protein
MISEFCTVKVCPFSSTVAFEVPLGIDKACPPMTTLEDKTCTSTLSILVLTGAAGALVLLDPTGVKGLLMIDAMIPPIEVVVGGWLTTRLVVGALLVEVGFGEPPPPPFPPPPAATGLEVVVAGLFVFEGIWKTGGAELDDPRTGTGVFLVTNTVLVKADPVDSSSVVWSCGANELVGACGTAAVMIVGGSWKERVAKGVEDAKAEHTRQGTEAEASCGASDSDAA